jgi:AcrR family transcriptional regulator
VALADAAGIGSLTMRRLAQELNVEAMSLYHHANEDDILDGMVDMVFGEIELPSEGTDWKTAMHQRATSGISLGLSRDHAIWGLHLLMILFGVEFAVRAGSSPGCRAG